MKLSKQKIQNNNYYPDKSSYDRQKRFQGEKNS